MRAKAVSVWGAALLLATAGAGYLHWAQTVEPKDFDDAVRRMLDSNHVPGAWVVVIKNGRVVKKAAYGVRDIQTKAPLTTSTYMHIGSVGKMFTAGCVLQLVADGKLRLDDSIADRFVGARPSWRKITVRDLLVQTSGLPDYLSARVLDYDRDYDEAEIVERVEQLEPTFAAGTRWDYSNTNYLLLGILVHRASGIAYPDYLRQRILKPNGIKSVFCEGNPPPGAVISKSYFGWDYPSVPRPPSHTMGLIADGCLWANVDGFVQWDRALDRMDHLPKTAKAQFWTAGALPDGTSTEYGAGWAVETHNGLPVYWHDGAWLGFSAFYARFPSAHMSIALCTNGGDVDIDAVGFELADRVLSGKG